MADDIQLCVDRVLPEELQEKAREAALSEHPQNAAMPSFAPDPATIAPRAALDMLKKWAPGRELYVRFLNGDDFLHQKVIQYAGVWMDHANVKFVFNNSPQADIRISFGQDMRSWSWLGTDARVHPQSEATVHFGWLKHGLPEERYADVILHELGHALGLIHEHQRPDRNLQWDEAAVIRYFSGPPNHWSPQDIRVQIFQTYNQGSLNSSEFDPQSIMMYAFDGRLFKDGRGTPWNTQLSEKDKELIARVYGPPPDKPDKGPPPDGGPLRLGSLRLGSWHEATLSRAGEKHLYSIKIEEGAAYTLITEGRTHVKIALYGDKDRTELVEKDDGSAGGGQSMINRELAEGTYYLVVEPHSSTGTGTYKIIARPFERL